MSIREALLRRRHHRLGETSKRTAVLLSDDSCLYWLTSVNYGIYHMLSLFLTN